MVHSPESKFVFFQHIFFDVVYSQNLSHNVSQRQLFITKNEHEKTSQAP